MFFIWLLPGFWFAMIVHEFGHAFFGWLAGVRLKQIVFGEEPTLIRKRFGETEFVLNAIPDTGYVLPYRIVGREAFRNVIFCAGGMLANAITCALLIVAVEGGYVAPHFKTAFGAFALAQAWGVLSNAIPWRSRNPAAPEEGSDGNQIWRHLRKPQDHAAPYFKALLAPYQNKSAPHEQPSWSAGLILDCKLRHNRWTSPNVQFDVFNKLTRELARSRMTRAEEMLTLETLIADWFVFAGPATPDEADQWSMRLLELGPDITTIKGTRGAVLTMIGRHAEGKAQLSALLQGPGLTIVPQLLTEAFLAHAEFSLGNSAEAHRLMNSASAIVNAHRADLAESTLLTFDMLAGRIGKSSEASACDAGAKQ
jgi:Peptidase family M50